MGKVIDRVRKQQAVAKQKANSMRKDAWEAKPLKDRWADVVAWEDAGREKPKSFWSRLLD